MNEKEELRKIKKINDLMYIFFYMKNTKRSFRSYFDRRNYKSVAVYGMGNLGKALVEELISEGVKVEYAIDKRAENIFYAIDIYEPDANSLKKVDILVITAIICLGEIEEKLYEKLNCDIVYIEDIIKECL